MTKPPFTFGGWIAKTASRRGRRAREQAPYPELAKLIAGFDGEAASTPEVLFFGDSVSLRVSRDDADTDTLPQMLAKRLGGESRLLSIAHTAYHAEVYSALTKVLRVTRTRPKLVILPINLRSFSPQWDLYPEWQFRDEGRAVDAYLANPELGIMGVNEVAMTSDLLRQFDAIPVRYALSDKTRVGEFRQTIAATPRSEQERASRRREIFIYHYTHLLDPGHRKLAALDDCVGTLAALGIPALVYITPINWSAGARYAGEEFVAAVEANVATVDRRFAHCGGAMSSRVVDFSMLLGSGCFFSEHDATEHLNQEGRERLVGELLQACRDMMGRPFEDQG